MDRKRVIVELPKEVTWEWLDKKLEAFSPGEKYRIKEILLGWKAYSEIMGLLGCSDLRSFYISGIPTKRAARLKRRQMAIIGEKYKKGGVMDVIPSD